MSSQGASPRLVWSCVLCAAAALALAAPAAEREWLAGDSHIHSHWSTGYDVPEMLQFYGMELNMPGMDHHTLIIPRAEDEASVLYEIESRFDANEDWARPPDPRRQSAELRRQALAHMQGLDRLPIPFANHPSRSAEAIGLYGRDEPWEFRENNDLAPDVYRGMEGAPGHQAATLTEDNSSRYRGSYWNPGAHFHYAEPVRAGSDFWPGEFHKTWVHARPTYASRGGRRSPRPSGSATRRSRTGQARTPPSSPGPPSPNTISEKAGQPLWRRPSPPLQPAPPSFRAPGGRDGRDHADHVGLPRAACVPNRLTNGIEAAQPEARPPARLARVHARTLVLLRLHLKMESQLFPCLGILTPIAEETTESPDEVGEQAHFAPPTQFSTPAAIGLLLAGDRRQHGAPRRVADRIGGA